MNFGQQGNGTTCSCGTHQGVGYFPDNTPLSPGDRAARYLRLKEKLPPYFTPAMGDYLESWEENHGKVFYDMRPCNNLRGGPSIPVPKVLGADIPIEGRAQSSLAQRNWFDE